MIQIKHRYTGAVLFEHEGPTLRDAVEAAVKAGASLNYASLNYANLNGANLNGASLIGASLNYASLNYANLDDANLDDASLIGASLNYANLNGANLNGANLNGANLNRANLDDANLDDASLIGASLNYASLNYANLNGANLNGANLDDASLNYASLNYANLDGANLDGARDYDPNAPRTLATPRPPKPEPRKRRTPAERAADYRARHPEVPVVEHLDAKILEAISTAAMSFDMRDWHQACGTTHCRAGFAIHLAGKAGYNLEAKLGPDRAGRAIYRASTGRAPHFYATTERALKDIKRCAEEDA